MEKKKFKPKKSRDNLTIEYNKDDFISSLPNLARELQKGNQPAEIKIDGVSHNNLEQRKKIITDPGAIDFIRRCSTEKEALEIIEFLEKQKEITLIEVKSFKKKLKIEGLKAFGSKKTPGYYDRGSTR